MGEKMRDEFRGNFSRDVFDPDNSFSRILMQQGKVLLDSDFNGLQDLMTYYLRTIAKDIIGPHGGLKNDKINSFKVEYDDTEKDITIAPGHYYVDGILCINNKQGQNGPTPLNYKEQEGYISDTNIPHSDGIYPLMPGKNLIYLDVWERSISYIQDDTLLETALGIGDADTTVRSKVVWQVKSLQPNEDKGCNSDHWKEWNKYRGMLMAGLANPKGKLTKDCVVSQNVQLMLQKNLLLRVEIHRAGLAGPTENNEPATFKWSCINGSADFKISDIARSEEIIDKTSNLKWDVATVTLDYPLNSGHLSLKVGDIVEIVDDIYILSRQAFPLWQVDSIEADSNQVILKRNQPKKYVEHVGDEIINNPLLRRWDQKQGDPVSGGLQLSDDNAAIIKEGSGSISDHNANWLNLGMGIAIQFQTSNPDVPFNYRTGDYWLIPVRALTGVDWPIAEPPHGVEHHYAPLAIITLGGDKTLQGDISDCRSVFDHISKPIP